MALPIRNAAQLKASLRNLRKTQHISQQQLAEKLGLTQGRISQLESYPERMTVDVLLNMLMSLEAELVIQPKSLPDSPSKGIW